MFHGSDVQTSLFAQLGDARSVVVRELSLGHDRVGDVRIRYQVDLENLGLESRLALVIILGEDRVKIDR